MSAVAEAQCCGCKAPIPLSNEQRLVSGIKGWWHSECHEVATAEVNRTMALRAVAKMSGYTGL